MPRLRNCPVCGTPLEVQSWANLTWVDCPSMHRLSVDPGTWDTLCREVLLHDIREYLAGLPPIPGSVDEG